MKEDRTLNFMINAVRKAEALDLLFLKLRKEQGCGWSSELEYALIDKYSLEGHDDIANILAMVIHLNKDLVGTTK